MNIHEYVNKLF